MRDLLTIIIAEKRTLLRGLFISFLFIFPFTFLPIIGHGLSWQNIIHRAPLSALYAMGFSLVIVIAAVGQNYNSLVERQLHFNKPAFTNLDFHGRLDGAGSITNELETFLLGKVHHYYFRLNLIDPDKKPLKVNIIPLIDLNGNEQLKCNLQDELAFHHSDFLGKIIEVDEKDLQNDRFIIDKLIELEASLTQLGVKPLEIDEKTLFG